MRIGTWYSMCEEHGREFLREGLDRLTTAAFADNEPCVVEGCGKPGTHEWWPGDEVTEASVDSNVEERLTDALERLLLGDEGAADEARKVMAEVAVGIAGKPVQ